MKTDLITWCKSQAKQKLSDSDWAMLPDVAIENRADFVSYREILRGYAMNPVDNPTWPDEPQPVWGK